VTVNVSDGGLHPMDLAEAQFKLSYEPRQTRDLNGSPVYRITGGDEILVPTRSAVPLWVSVCEKRADPELVSVLQWVRNSSRSPFCGFILTVGDYARQMGNNK
jgi:hypothetical protein